jgi:DNA-binding transcriptional ArsR family regulator
MVSPTDLETSHEAAVDASFKASKHRLMALKALLEVGPMTDYQLASATGLQQNSIGKRRKDCQDAGLVTFFLDENSEKVRRKTPSGSSAFVWEITEEGRNFMNSIKE